MIRELIPKPVRKQLSKLPFIKSPVWWANLGPLSGVLAQKFPPQSPPVLVLSLTRSGSSWAGEILGLAPNAMYLREPINQFFLQKHPEKTSIFEFELNNPPDAYAEAADIVFSASPSFSYSIVPNAKQWRLLRRKSKRLVIKEVNPFMIKWLIQEYHPKIIYLLRHPAAVTYSYVRHGWTGRKFESGLLDSTLKTKVPHYEQFTHSFWSEHGAFQAFILNEVLGTVKDNTNVKITKYEDLCADPIQEYKKLYEFAQLEWDHNVEQTILKRCNPETVNKDSYSTQRNSSYEMDKWKHEVQQDNILELKKAYLSFNPPYYKDNWPK